MSKNIKDDENFTKNIITKHTVYENIKDLLLLLL
jgi:hypothetical protein